MKPKPKEISCEEWLNLVHPFDLLAEVMSYGSFLNTHK